VTAGLRFTIDSNILIYAVDARFPERRASALDILTRAVGRDCVLTPQALAEFFHAVTRKGLMPRAEAAAQLHDWSVLYPVVPGPTPANLIAAAAEAAAGRFQFYDALLLATAAAAACLVIISEDMHRGAQLGDLRVVGAFDDDGRVSAEARALL
jgi:predicted nucleic acid-binding protein